MTRALIYIVDDDEAVLDSLRVVLEVDGFDVQTYTSGEAFLGDVGSCQQEAGQRSCLLLDMQMPGMSGLDVIDAVSDRDPSLPVIVMTGAASASEKQSARDKGARQIFDKPLALDALYGEIDQLFN